MGIFKSRAEKVYESVASEYPGVFNTFHLILTLEEPQEIVDLYKILNNEFNKKIEDGKTVLVARILVKMGYSDAARAVFASRWLQVREKNKIALAALSNEIVKKYPNPTDFEQAEVECLNLYCKYSVSKEKDYDLPKNQMTMSMSNEFWAECINVFSTKGKIDLITWKELREKYRS